jgi:uncharacterized repeat protein (TIGR01451 family)
MKKKLLIKHYSLVFLSFLVIALLSFMAEAKDLHNDWHYSGDTFTVDGDVVMITHFDFYDPTVLLQINKNTYIMREGECKQTATRDFCVTEIFSDINTQDEDAPIKFEGGVAYAGIKILVRTRGPDVKISRSFSTTSPELNQEVTVTVTVENTGDEGTDSFIYTDLYPAGVIITSLSSGKSASHSITYDLNFPVHEEKSFTYAFKVTDYLEFSTQPKAYFTFAGQNTSVSVSAVSVKVIKPYAFTSSISSNSFEVGEQATLNAKIENKVSEEINVEDFRIMVPSLISVQSTLGEPVKNNSTYYWQGSLDSGENKAISIVLKPTKSGNYIIPVSVKIKDSKGKSFSETTNLSLSATLKPLEIILSVLETSVSEGSSFRVAFSVKNPNKNIGFRNIKAGLRSEIFPELGAAITDLMPGKTQTLIVNDTLTAPFLDEKKIYDIEAYGTYESTTNEKLNFSKKATLTVTPVSQVITITQGADKQEVLTGENVTLTIKIINNNQQAIQVNVSDKYSDGVSLIGGKAAEPSLSFDSAGTKQAYTYKLHVPLDYKQSELAITTFASIPAKDYALNKTLTLKIKGAPQKAVEENKSSEQKTPETPQAEEKKDEKQGFFEKLINGISGFFKRLLGKK